MIYIPILVFEIYISQHWKAISLAGKHWYTGLIFPTLEILIKNPKLENNSTNWKNIGILISFFHPWDFQ